MAKKDDGKQSYVTMAVKIAVVVLGAMVAGGAYAPVLKNAPIAFTIERNAVCTFTAG